MLTNEFADLVLLRLCELTISSIQSGRPLFGSPIDEPVFYGRYFRRWVEDALEEKRAQETAEASFPFPS